MTSAGTKQTNRMPTLRHDAPALLPSIQKIAERTESVSANVSTSHTTATRNALTTTPASSKTRVSSERLPPTLNAMRKTSSIATAPPAKAATGRAHTVRIDQPVTTVSTAPAAAPLDTP